MIAAMATRTTAGPHRPASVADLDFEMAVAGICGSRRSRGAAAAGASLSAATFPQRGVPKDHRRLCSEQAAAVSHKAAPTRGRLFLAISGGGRLGRRAAERRVTVKQEQARLPDGRRACSCFVEPLGFPVESAESRAGSVQRRSDQRPRPAFT